MIAEITTEKLTNEVPAPESGILSKIIAAEGDVTVTGGTKTIGTGNGNFSVSATATDAATSGVITIKVSVSGKVTDGGPVTLNLTNGRAISGAITTPDNTTLPVSSDRAQVVTLKPLAGSSNISF